MSTQARPSTRVEPPRLVPIPSFSDERGELYAAEAYGAIPFAIERVYWISSVPEGALRGCHAHRSVHEALVAIAGTFTVRWECRDDRGEVELRTSSEALVLPPLLWREVTAFSPGAVCLVLASGPYDDAEYVHDREELTRLLDAS